MNKSYIYILIVGIAVFSASYYIWFSPLFMIIGIVIAIADIGFYVHYLFKKDNDVIESLGCLVALVCAILLAVSFFMGGKTYISSFGGYRHIYMDCHDKEGDSWYHVGKLSAYIWGCFDECQTCKNRKKADDKRKLQQLKEREKVENLNFINQQISELEEVRQSIINGEDVDIDDYRFSYDVEDEIYESAIEDYKDVEYEPRGRR